MYGSSKVLPHISGCSQGGNHCQVYPESNTLRCRSRLPPPAMQSVRDAFAHPAVPGLHHWLPMREVQAGQCRADRLEPLDAATPVQSLPGMVHCTAVQVRERLAAARRAQHLTPLNKATTVQSLIVTAQCSDVQVQREQAAPHRAERLNPQAVATSMQDLPASERCPAVQVQEEQAAARRAERLRPANAATTVQTAWRGLRARRELARLQQERAEAEAAIRAMQAQVRG